RAQLRYGNLEIGEDFQQESLKRRACLINFVDEQNRRRLRLQRLQDGACDQEIRTVDMSFEFCPSFLPPRLADEFERHSLQRLVPLVQGFGLINAFVALQTDEWHFESGR